MAKYETTVCASPTDVASYLHRAILASGMSTELVEQSTIVAGTVETHVYVYEKYYMRASNRASLTLVLVGDGRQTQLSAIGAGGGQGVFFRLSWGTEENFVSTVRDAMKQFG